MDFSAAAVVTDSIDVLAAVVAVAAGMAAVAAVAAGTAAVEDADAAGGN